MAPLLLVAAMAMGSFKADAQELVLINTGTPQSPLYAVGPVYVSSTLFYTGSRFAYLYTENELAAAGITAGTIIRDVGWMKSTGSSTSGPALFRIYMKNSATVAYSDPTALWSGLVAPAVLVYEDQAQAIASTATPDFIVFMLDAPFVYTGGSLEILTEWDISNGPSPIATGSFEWVNTQVADRIYGNAGTSLPASLSSTMNNTSIDDRRPVIQLGVHLNTTVVLGLEQEQGVGLFPNPAGQVLSVMNRSGMDFSEVTLIDLLGKTVRTERQLPNGGNLQLPVDGLAPGTHLLRMTGPDGTVVKRFQVQ